MSELSFNKNGYNLKNKTHDIQGGEKKVMKKSLKVIATATLAFSMFASVAMAADTTTTAPTTTTTTATTTVKTSKDFTDLAGLDAALLAKVDALLAKGYMDGKGDKFDVTGNMTRAEAAKLVAKIFGLTVGTETSSSFKDVDGTDASIAWSIPFIEAAKKAGIIDGMTDTTFAPKDNVTLGQLATLLVKGFGKAGDVKTTTPWYQGYLDVAKAAGVDLGADGSKLATRGDLVVGSYAADVAVAATKAASITEVKATGVKKITVSFNKAIDPAKVTFGATLAGNTVNVAKTTPAADNKSVDVEFPNNLAKGEYTVTVKGASATDLTGKVTVEAEKVVKIEFLNDKGVLSRTTATQITTSLKVSNQYGENVNGTYASGLTFTSSSGTVSSTTGGVVTITAPAGATFKAADKVSLSAIHQTSSTFASTVLTVSDKAQVATVSVSSLYNADAKTPVVNSADAFYLVLDVKDQYGNAMTAGADIREDILVSSSNTSVLTIDPVTVGTATYANVTSLTIDGVSKTVLKVVPGATKGASLVTIISKTSGNVATFNVDVKDIVKVDTLTIGTPTVLVAGEKTEIPFTAVDQFGAAITKATDLTIGTGATNAITSLSASDGGAIAFEQDYVKNVAKLKYTPAVGSADKSVVITGVTSTGKIVQQTLAVTAVAVPTVITATKDFTPGLALNATANLTTANVVVKDQYGRDITPTYGVASVATNYQVVVATSDSSKVSLTDAVTDAVYTIDNSAVSYETLTGVAKGSSTITLKLQKGGVDVANSSYTFTSKVVEKKDIASYEIADVAKLFDGNGTTPAAGYSKTLTVNGVLADGSKVAVPNTYYTVTVPSTLTYAGSVTNNVYTGKLTANATGTIGYADANTNTKDFTVIATVDGADGAVVLTKTVTVSRSNPSTDTLAVVTAGVATKEDTNVASVALAGIASGYTTLVNNAIKAVDQYGVELTGGTEPAYQVIITNTPTGRTITSSTNTLIAGDTFNVTAIIGTKTITFKVIVKAV